MAAGTGGHVFPALAVAQALQAQGHQVSWLATHQGMEHRLLADQPIPLFPIDVQGLRGNGLLRLFKAPLMILTSTWAALRVIRQQQIDVIAGFGGYVAGPGGLAARLAGRRLVIHEQNAIAGMTNRYLARLAAVVCQAFPSAFAPSAQVLTTGNPVRQPILSLPAPAERFAGRHGPLRILVVGGSLGAKALNDQLPAAFASLCQQGQSLQIRHQCGQAAQAELAVRYAELAAGSGGRLEAEVVAFIQDMAGAYGQADLVICRAGALTVTELACAGVPAVFVPLPHAVDDHQTANARYLVDAGAACLLPQSQLDQARLLAVLQPLLDRTVLLQMAEKAAALGQRDATAQVVRAILAAS